MSNTRAIWAQGGVCSLLHCHHREGVCPTSQREERGYSSNRSAASTKRTLRSHRRHVERSLSQASFFNDCAGSCCYSGFSLVEERGCSLAVVHGLLVAVAPLAAERGLRMRRAACAVRGGSVVAAPGPGAQTSGGCGARALLPLRGTWVFLDQEGSNSRPLHW